MGAHSIRLVCQNFVNCPEDYLSPQKTQKAAVFLCERSWKEEWFKILTNVNTWDIFVLNAFELAHKKMIYFELKNALKSLKRYIWEQKLEGFFSET